MAHYGSNGMYYAVVWIAPMMSFAIFVCTNEALDSRNVARQVALGIVRIAEEY